MQTEQDFIKLHKAENDPNKAALIHELFVKNKAAQEGQKAALAAQRAADGQKALTCPKCGAESVVDAKRPEKPAAKCGAMKGPVSKDGVQAPCGTPLEG